MVLYTLSEDVTSGDFNLLFMNKSFSQNFTDRIRKPALVSRMPALVGSKEAVGHTHEWLLLIGQHLPGYRLGTLVIVGNPTCIGLIIQPVLRQILTNKVW